MPIKLNTNNRVLPNNVRAVDPAKETIHKLIAVQNRKHHAAFQVQGFKACLYHPLTSGVTCACRNKQGLAASLLDMKGRAPTHLLNELLTGERFNVTPYGVVPSNMRQGYVDEEADYVTDSDYQRTNQSRPDPDTGSTAGGRSAQGLADRPMGSIEAGYATSADDPRAKTIVPLEYDDDGNIAGDPVLSDEMDFLSFTYENPNAQAELEQQTISRDGTPILFDGEPVVFNGNPLVYDAEDAVIDVIVDKAPQPVRTDLFDSAGALVGGYTDISCPMCFGTGFVGGYSLHNGYRVVKSVADRLTYDEGASIDLQSKDYPGVDTCTTVTFTTVLPHAVGVDAARAFSGMQILPAIIKVDGTPLNGEQDLLRYCDGRDHTFLITFAKPVFFTHFEIQLNQSHEWALFEFPRITRSGMQTIMDDTDPFTVNVSPMIPYLAPKSLIAESTYGKMLLVRSVPSWNDRNRNILGWDAEVRVVQPSELWIILPHRLSMESPTRPPMVRDNSFGRRRT